MPRDVLLGVVLGAHGLKGEVRVKSFAATAKALGAYGTLHTKDGRSFAVASLRAVKDGEAILRFAEIADRGAAEALKGVELFVAREALPPAGEGEFYHADLIGLKAEDAEGRVLGRVSAIHNFGAGDVIEIARDADDTVLLPFTREVVPSIALAEGRIVIAVPEEVETGEKGNLE